MSGRRRASQASRVPLLALAVAMFLVGGYLVVHAGLKKDDAAAVVKPKASAKPTAKATADPSAAAQKVLGQAVDGRSAALKALAEKAQKLTKKRLTERPVVEFKFAQFNIQGSTHRGNVGGRMGITTGLLNRYGVDVAALQEFARNQQGIFNSQTGGSWGCYPCQSGPKSLDGENSVVWRKSRFNALKLETRPYPYFGGSIRNMPVVLLRDKKTGVAFWVTSYHNPANVHGPAGKWRAIAVSRQIADNNNLRRTTKQPIIVSGDMNDRAAYYCRMGPGTGMHSADGSNANGGCRLAGGLWIDWILGTSDVDFSNYVRDNSGTVRAASDHPILVTDTKITGAPGEGKYAEK